MLEQPKQESYYDGFNEYLFREVPPDSRRIVEVGCARGRLGMELKAQVPDRYVIGIEQNAEAATFAQDRLDEVHLCDLETDFPDIQPGTIDVVIFGDVLEHLYDPEEVLRKARTLLAHTGSVLVCVPNFTHFSILKTILRADPMYQPAGLLDATHIRFFSHATFIKMLLDVGLLPELVHVIGSGGTEHLIPAATPLLEYFGVDPGRALRYLDAYQYIFKATRTNLPDQAAVASASITFVACVNDEDQLESNLARSPCLAPGTEHELLTFRGMTSAAQGWSAGLEQARNDLVVLVQQDMYLPNGWDCAFTAQFEQAEHRFGPIGVAGVFGLLFRDGDVANVGQIIDRDTLLDTRHELPTSVDVLDEVVLAVRKSSGLRADPALGFHLYGADLCLMAASKGLTNVALSAPSYHNSLFANLSPAYHAAREYLLDKWPDVRPMYTNMGRLDTMQTPKAQPSPAAGVPAIPDVAHVQTLEATIARLESRLAAVESTRAWKLRNWVNRIFRRA